MLTVTKDATTFLAKMLDDAKAPEGAAARLTPSQEGIGLQLDQERDGDTTFQHKERTVLVLQGGLADRLSEHTLDAQETGDGKSLVLVKSKDDEGEGAMESG